MEPQTLFAMICTGLRWVDLVRANAPALRFPIRQRHGPPNIAFGSHRRPNALLLNVAVAAVGMPSAPNTHLTYLPDGPANRIWVVLGGLGK